MMNNIKKILSMVLCLAMLLSMNASAFATEGEGGDVPQCTHESFNEEVTTPASCTADGVKTFSCAAESCEYSYTEPVAATGHNYVEGVCTNCGDVAVCNKEETCPANSHEADCLKKQADDAKIASVNALIAALPEKVTTKNYDAVMSQLETIKAYETEMGEQWNQLDLVKLNAVIDGTYDPVSLVDNPVAKIGEHEFASLADALNKAGSMTGDVTVEIYDKVTLTTDLSGSYDSIKFVGIGDAAEISIGTNIYYIRAIGKQVAFEGLTLSKANAMYGDGGQMGYAFGIYQANSVSYTNCYFANGAYAAGANSVTFTGCTFLSSYDEYGLWTYGNVAFTVDGCVFKSVAGIKLFTEGGGQNVSATVGNTDFSNLSDTEKPAIVMTNAKALTLLADNEYPATNRIVRLEAGANGASFSSTDPVTCFTKNSSGDYEASGVLVDGKIYITAADAAAAATNGSKVTLLHDTTEVVEFPACVELDKNGHDAAKITVAKPPVKIGEKGFMTLQAALDSEEAKTENVVIELLQDATLDITAWNNLAIGADNAKTITINGNGKTLTFNKENSDWNHVATKNNAKLILNNMTITDSGYNNGPWNRYDIGFACPVELNNVTATKALAFKSDAVLKNVTINETGDNYAIWVQAKGQNISIDGLTVNSAGRGIKIDDEYVGDSAAEVKLSVENATFTTAKKSAIMVKSVAGANITVGSNVDITNVAADKTNAVWVDEDGSANFGKVTVTGATVAQENKDAMVAAVYSGDKLVGYHATLAKALEKAQSGDTVKLLANCAESVTVSQAPDYVITIDGAGKTMTGSITVDGKSGTYKTSAVTIKNINFNASAITTDACINLGVKDNDNTRYTCNVTVDSCSFTGGNREKAAIKSYTGGDYNLTVTNCTVDETMHSLLQATNINGVVIDDCTVKSKNGINLNSSSNVEIKNSEISVSGYAVRAGVDGGTSGKITLENNTLATDNSEGDAVIIVRGSAVEGVDLDMNKNVVSGNTHISGNTAATDITANANYWGEGKTGPVVSGEAVPVVSYYEDAALTKLVISDDAVAQTGDDYFLSIQDAVYAADAGALITVLQDNAPAAPIVIEKNLTIDFANKEMACADIYPVIRVQGGATLTVKNGNITNNDYIFVLGSSDSSTAGNLNIESGTYHGTTTVVSVTKGNLHISGGNFSADPYEGSYDFLLNCYDPNRADCHITVVGGTFANFDPANNAAEGANTNFVPANFASVADGSNYTVKPLVTVSFNDAEMIRGNAQPSYTYSTNADVHGLTVEVTPASITLNDNTSTYDITGAVVVKNGSTDVTANCVVRVTKGTLTVTEAAVKLSSGNTDSYHETLAAANAAAKDGDTITLLADSAENLAVADNITLALNGNDYTGSVTVASGKQLSMSAADLKTLTDGLKVTGDVKIGDTEIGLENGGTVKVDAKGNLVATPTAAGDGFVAVEVNEVVVLVNSGSVTIDSKGTASFSNYALVLLADGSVAVLENGGSVDKTGAVTTTPAEATDDKGNKLGYGEVIVISKDGKTKTGYLVPAGASLTVKYDSKAKALAFTSSSSEGYIKDDKADRKDYLSVDPVKKSFYNKSYVSMTFTCNGFLDANESIIIKSSDGKYTKIVDDRETTYFDVDRGSTVVKLKNSYLRNLALGTYTLTFTYADGQTASATFHVVNTPITGDYNNLAPFAAVMGFSVLALAIVLVLLKKRRA